MFIKGQTQSTIQQKYFNLLKTEVPLVQIMNQVC
jgi:hypothetical protein